MAGTNGYQAYAGVPCSFGGMSVYIPVLIREKAILVEILKSKNSGHNGKYNLNLKSKDIKNNSGNVTKCEVQWGIEIEKLTYW